MPSAASIKLEKQLVSNIAEASAESSNACTPVRQALVIIEHKIRNLEKRKTKLESYRTIQSSGKELSSDQKVAVSKYEEVAQCLDFARDLSKQIGQLVVNYEKDQKKQARRDASLRSQAEISKIREVLTIQDILSYFTDLSVRDDFLQGRNGAIKLEENDLNLLELFYNDIRVNRQSSLEDSSFSLNVQKSAELLSLTIDKRAKAYGETTFENLGHLLQTIQDCGYFDKEEKKADEIANEEPQNEDLPYDNENDQPVAQDSPSIDDNSSDVATNEAGNLVQYQRATNNQASQFRCEAPSAAAVPAPAFSQPPPQHNNSSNITNRPHIQNSSEIMAHTKLAHVPQIPQGNVNTLQAAYYPPTTVRAVEQAAYFNQHQYIQQQMRPLAEVIGSANFFFLQESELDSGDLVPLSFNPSEQGSIGAIPVGNLSSQLSKDGKQAVSEDSQKDTIAIEEQKDSLQKESTIASQTFTNQSFSVILPANTIFQQQPTSVDVQNSNQSSEFHGQIVAPAPASMSATQRSPQEYQHLINQPVTNVPQVAVNLIASTKENAVLVGFPQNQFSANQNISNQEAPGNIMLQSGGQYNPLQEIPGALSENTRAQSVSGRELQDESVDEGEWKNNDPAVSEKGQSKDDPNQWKNETENNKSKTSNDWSMGFDNQNESNTWTNAQGDNYTNRGSMGRVGYSGSGRANNTRPPRHAGGAPPSNGFRGRSTNSYHNPNNRSNGVYFRNNENNFYQQNQNGNFNNVKPDNAGNGPSSYRSSRGGHVGPATRQPHSGSRVGMQSGAASGAPPRNNSNSNRNSIGLSNPGSRQGRTSMGIGYGNVRPTGGINVRQQHQDINV